MESNSTAIEGRESAPCSPSSDTPETDKFRASLDGMRPINQRDRLLFRARRLERERDDARRMWSLHQDKLAELREQVRLNGLCPSDATACSPSSDTPETQRKIKRICGNWNNAGDRVQEFVLADVARKLERERDEARAMARDMRNQLEKDSVDRLIFPWENAEPIRAGVDSETN